MFEHAHAFGSSADERTVRPVTLVFLPLVTTLVACASVQIPSFARPANAVPYRAYVVRTALDPDELFDAAQRVAFQDSDVVRVDARRRRVLSTERLARDVRERRDVRVSPDGRVRIRIHTELMDGSGRWVRSDAVCPTYAHARERALATALLHALGRPERARTLMAMQFGVRSQGGFVH